MTLRDRVAWASSWVAPLAGLAAVAVLLLLVFAPMRTLLSDGRAVAWVVGVLVVLFVLSHLTIRLHTGYSGRFGPDEQAQLRFKLDRGRGYRHWRELMQGRGAGPHPGRSHSGERPRFD
jgi:hypothetical protein